MTAAEVGEILLLDEDTGRAYFDKYTSGNLVALLKNSYQGSNKKLTEDQINFKE